MTIETNLVAVVFVAAGVFARLIAKRRSEEGAEAGWLLVSFGCFVVALTLNVVWLIGGAS